MPFHSGENYSSKFIFLRLKPVIHPYVKAISIVCDGDYYRMYHLIHTVTSAKTYSCVG